MTTSFMSVGNGELEDAQKLCAEDLVYCDNCHEFHPIQITQAKRFTIESMRCPATNKCFIVGVGGRLLKGWTKYTDTPGD